MGELDTRPRSFPIEHLFDLPPVKSRQIESPATAGYMAALPRIREEIAQIRKDKISAQNEFDQTIIGSGFIIRPKK